MKLRTQLLLGYSLVFVLMVLMAVVGQQSTQKLILNQNWLDHSYQVITTARGIDASIQTLRAEKRGYLLTGNPALLKDYRLQIKAYESEMALLKPLVSDNLPQVQRLEDVQVRIGQWFDTTETEIAMRAKVDDGKLSLERMASEFGSREIDLALFKDIDNQINAFIEIERGLLTKRNQTVEQTVRLSNMALLIGTALSVLLGVGVMFFITRKVLRQVGGEPAEIAAATEQIAQGNLEVPFRGGTGIAASVAEMATTLKDVARQANVVATGDYSLDIAPRSDKDELGIALRTMNTALRTAHEESAARDWLKTGLARLNEVMQGDPDIDALAARVVGEVAGRLDAKVGALYIAQEDGVLVLMGSYAYVQRKNLANRFRPGEGLVGQAALEKQQILIHNVPEDYIHVSSGLGEHVPRFICVTPFLHESRLRGVLEFGTLNDISPAQLDYLQQAMPALAVAVDSAQARTQLARTLAESQQLAEELQAQQEELKVANEELEEQTQRLKSSEEKLKAQQEELQVSNEELEEKNELLQRQKREVDQARKELSTKADELALASKYKSEFLANMSHELRTPLNSLLLLAQSLAQNKEGNLTGDQVESAQVIYGSGNDLLNLINEILDLSKIEAGRMDLNLSTVALAELSAGLRASFDHMAREKSLGFEIRIDPDLPGEIVSDRKRLDQILRNLLSNALKFTEKGGIEVAFARAASDVDLARSGQMPDKMLAIAVRDTGIGIPPEKHKLIFEAFQQADGTTTRKYGGTGLGLTISRELAALLGGEIHLRSEPGAGSTFTLYVPLRSEPAAPAKASATVQPQARPPQPPSPPVTASSNAFIQDDEENLAAGDSLILIIEDDPKFAAILVGKCHERGFKALAAPSGEIGLDLAAGHQPNGVILDIRLPGMDGMAVLAALKEDIRTRHIPVHVVSVDEHRAESLRRGAVGHAVKPLDMADLDGVFAKLAEAARVETKRVLVVEDNARIRAETVELIGNSDVQVDEAATGEAAKEKLRQGAYDAVVLDLRLPDIDGRTVLEQLEQEGVALPPVIVHTALQLSAAEEAELRGHTDSIVVKDVRSPERLLDEVSLFLHRVVSEMPEKQRRIIHELYDSDTALLGKKVLVVDDDMRTTFAVSKLLAEHGMQPVKAENGERALHVLDENPDVSIVLMDVMMPVMDGYETMRRIRAQDRFRTLPIIALTAKAMPEDREKCIAAGASDYLPKPVDTARLFSLMRVWLYP